MSISQLFPEEGPSLSLNLAGSRTLDPRITFTRTSSGTRTNSQGLVEVVPANSPRFDHRYVNGEIESLGLLVEESRSNIFPWSETFISGWGGGGTINLDSSIVDPRGNTGTVYYPTVSEWTRNFNGGGVTFLTLSFFTKINATNGGGSTRIQIYQETAIGEPSNVGTYNFSLTGANGNSGRFTNIVRVEYPNGWYRFSVRVASNPSAGQGTFTSTSRVDLEGGFNSNYVWGIQVEPSAEFATSYIPTSGSTVTRTADNASMTGTNFSNWYNPSESTFFVSFRQIYDASATVPPKTPHVLQIGNTTTVNDNYTIRAGQTSTRWDCLIRSASPSSLQFPGISNVGYLNSTTQYKSALSVSSSLISVSLNGLISADNANTTTVNHTTQFNKLFIGSGTGGSPPYELCGHISQLIYYPTRLSNAQLVSLTR